MEVKVFESLVMTLVDTAEAAGTDLREMSTALEEIMREIDERADRAEPVTKYDERHGGPYDRGGADSYYRRRFRPHYYINGTGTSPEITEENMTQEEIKAYTAGFKDNEESGNFK